MLSAKYVWNDGYAAGEHGNDSAAGRNVHTASAADVTDAIPTGKHFDRNITCHFHCQKIILGIFV